jgi:3-oxoadipate enol-lactonase
MALIEAGDIELSYERGGSGPPLLLIMGMSGTMYHWGRELLEDLRRDFDTIVYDHRGVGESAASTGTLTIAEMAEDAAALLGALELESAHVVGISMGGMVAQELALSHPELVRTLVLGCTYCGGEGSTLTSEDVLRRLAEGMASGDRQQAIRTGWEVNVSPSFASDEGAYAKFLEIGMRHAVAVPVIMEQMRAVVAHNTCERLPSLSVPTLVVHGTLDRMLPVQNGEMIAELIPEARLEILEGIGHLFFWEQPKHAAELIREHAALRV